MTGGSELVIILIVAVVLFGAGWLPKAARNLGKAKVEFDNVQTQFNETKNSVVEATGVKELESTMRKANKALSTSPQQMLKNAAKSAGTAKGAKVEGDNADNDIEDAEDAEIVETDSDTAKTKSAPTKSDTNVNVDFSE